MPRWVAKGRIGTLLLASEIPVPIPRSRTVLYLLETRKLEGETENMGVCTKERKGVTAAVLMATPCTNSLGGESGGQKH